MHAVLSRRAAGGQRALRLSMKIAILSRNSRLYSTRRLVEAGRVRGHTVRVLDPLRCYMRIGTEGFSWHYKGRPLTGYDAVTGKVSYTYQSSGQQQE